MEIKRCYDTIVGASVAENQLASTSTRSTQASAGVTFTLNNGSYSITGTASGRVLTTESVIDRQNIYINHKYAFILSTDISPIKLRISSGTSTPFFTASTIVNCTADTNLYAFFDSLSDIAGTTLSKSNVTIQLVDLTAKFGSSIADYVYQLETATAGSGIAWLRSYGFLGGYVPYNAGSIESVEATAHKMVGFNQWDEEWEVGLIAVATGQNINGNGIRSKNMCKCLSNTNYYVTIPYTYSRYIFWYDSNGDFIFQIPAPGSGIVTPPSNACYFRLRIDTVLTYNHDVCINLSNPDRNGEYEAYTSQTYALGSDVLNGIFKLDANNQLYADGDRKTSDGVITRKYNTLIINGDTDVSAGASGMPFRVPISGKKSTSAFASDPNGICDKLTGVKQSSTWGVPFTFSFVMNKDFMYFKLSDSITTIEDAKTYLASNPITLVYELATPTTETSTPFTSPQLVYPDGTEEFVTENGVPVGHETKYQL